MYFRVAQVWGSYGRSATAKMDAASAANVTLSDVDTSALAKLTLNSTQVPSCTGFFFLLGLPVN